VTPKKKNKKKKRVVRAGTVAALRVREIDSIRDEIEKKKTELLPRWNANPEDVQKSVAQLVLALVEFLRKLLERQAIRRMEAETLTPEEVERVGLALMRLEETVASLAREFGLEPEDLNLDLGPLGKLS
jgi:hypothetical protein